MAIDPLSTGPPKPSAKSMPNLCSPLLRVFFSAWSLPSYQLTVESRTPTFSPNMGISVPRRGEFPPLLFQACQLSPTETRKQNHTQPSSSLYSTNHTRRKQFVFTLLLSRKTSTANHAVSSSTSTVPSAEKGTTSPAQPTPQQPLEAQKPPTRVPARGDTEKTTARGRENNESGGIPPRCHERNSYSPPKTSETPLRAVARPAEATATLFAQQRITTVEHRPRE